MPLLAVEELEVSFSESRLSGKERTFKALNKVSFELESGEVLGIVGESGCGKSTLARAILQLQPVDSGRIVWKGQSLNEMSAAQQTGLKKQLQLIFQDPLDALNPRMTVGQIIAEPLKYLRPELTREQRDARVLELMQQMGLQAAQKNRYPHEFSGGQCQRVGIARAMIVEPELLVCDEPVSALDVSIQAQILNLLKDLQQRTVMSMLFISHDLSIVRHLCDRIMVLYQGEVVEINDAEMLYQSPQHPYTRSLLAAVPLADPVRERQRIDALINSTS